MADSVVSAITAQTNSYVGSKKKEVAYLNDFRTVIDDLAKENDARVIWDEPLTEERRG